MPLRRNREALPIEGPHAGVGAGQWICHLWTGGARAAQRVSRRRAACSRGAGARTAVFECKQARADLLKDAHAEAATRRRLEELAGRRCKLEELLAVHRPDLRRGEALWPEYDAWDFSSLSTVRTANVLAQLASAQRRIVRGTKFSKMFRYRCADFLYLVVEDGIFAEAEVPAGWGLLIRRGEALERARPRRILTPQLRQRAALLESIAMAGTRA